jgi:glycosyltransferase involved in cell wall biosynthesis
VTALADRAIDIALARTPRRSVVLFTNSWTMGGMEEHLVVLAGGLVARGADVAALCPGGPGTQALRERLQRAGVHVKVLPDRGRTPRSLARRILALARAIRERPGCIVHLHLTGHAGGTLIVLVSRIAGARAVVRTEHLPPATSTGFVERVAVSVRDRLMRAVICVSAQNRREHIDRLRRDPAKLTVVPNCVDLTRYDPAAPDVAIRDRLGVPSDAPLVGTVSRLDEERKGIAHFLEMAATVSCVYADARFLVVGDGWLRPKLERLARELGVHQRVLFVGERRDIPDLLSAMTVFVMSSLYEGGPYTVLEAMAAARPVVATPVGLVPDLIRDGETGLIAPIGDSYGLAHAVLRLLEDAPLRERVRSAGYEAVRARYGADRMVDGVLEVYRSAG